MTNTLSFSNKPAKLGNKIQARAEKHGEETVPAKDIPVKGVMLTEKQLCALVNDQIWNSFYDRGSKPIEPAHPELGAFKMRDKFKDCSGKIVFGLSDKEVEFEDATVKSIKLEPQVGGLTEMSCLIQCKLEARKEVIELEDFLDKDIRLSLKLGEVQADEDDEQPELDMDHREKEDGAGEELRAH